MLIANPFRGRATGSALGLADADEARRALGLFADPENLMALQGLPSGRVELRPGGDLDGLLAAAERLSDDRGVYWMLNPARPGVAGPGVKVGEIAHRRWLLIDVDPERPPESNATQAEKDLAFDLGGQMLEWLTRRGWPAPIVVDSGNGWHLLYRIDLPADDASRVLLRSLLKALAGRFDTASARVDTKVHNANRVSKLPGSWARKGPHSKDRPNRQARLWHAPETVEVVPLARIEEAVAELGQAGKDTVAEASPPTPPRNPFVGRAHGEDGTATAYARAALEGELAKLRAAAVGRRNVQLNESAFAIGTLVGAGLIGEAETYEALRSAAYQIGLTEPEVSRTVRSGLEAGRQQPRVLPELNGLHAKAHAESVAITADDVATIDDLIRAGSEVCWLWPGWLPSGVLAVLAAEGGTGKTRFCADLVRRIRYGLPWPDGAPMTLSPESIALWVMSDNHHDEMVTVAQAFGIKDSLRVNASKADPFGGVTLDDPAELAALEARIRAVRPALVLVDTVGNATDRNLSRQEDAKAFYQPLQIIARRNRVAVVCVTHLNASGAVLGRRALEKVRLAIQMERPDPENQPDRRRLWVGKSNAKYPPVLGVTMGDHGNEYDLTPPPRSGGFEPGKKPAARPKVGQAAEWLQERLKVGAVKVGNTRNEAEEAGIAAPALYAAKKLLGVEEFESEGKKWWRLAETDEGEA